MHRIRLRPDPPAGRQKCGTHDGSRNTRARISREGYGQSALGCAVSQVIGFHQGKERDPLGSCIRREETKLRRPALLGERVLRIHSGAGHRSDTGLHQEARRGGHAPRADELVALTATFRWPQSPLHDPAMSKESPGACAGPSRYTEEPRGTYSRTAARAGDEQSKKGVEIRAHSP